MITILDCEKVELLKVFSVSWMENGVNANVLAYVPIGYIDAKERSVDVGFITPYRGDRVNPCTHLTVDGCVWAVDIATSDPGPNIFPYFYFHGVKMSYLGNFSLSHICDRGETDGHKNWTEYQFEARVIDNCTVYAKYVTETYSWSRYYKEYIHNTNGYTSFYTRASEKTSRWTCEQVSITGTSRTFYANSSWKSSAKSSYCWVPSAEGIIARLPSRTSKIDDLLDECISQTKFTDVNSLAYLKDAFEIGTMALSTIKAIKSLDNPKSWADLFLSVKYGWKMTIVDTLELSEALGRAAATAPRKYETYHASRLTDDWRESLSFRVDNSASPGTSLRQMINWGIWPTAKNLWDFVPFSFVVNWLTGLNGIMQAIDDNVILCHLPASNICHSWKFSGEIQATALNTNLCGTLSVRYYQRNVLKTLPWKKFKLDSINGLSGHGAELTAIVVQKYLGNK